MTRVLRAAVAVLALLFVAAELRFILAAPVSESVFVRTQPDPAGRFNLAQASLGLTLRASSADWSDDRHPAYALHGRADKNRKSWVSVARDREPWIEVEFDRPRHVDEVVLVSGDCTPQSNAGRYVVTCFAGDHVVGAREGDDRELTGDGHALDCAAATRVRVTFAPDATHAPPVARLCGFEVWGS